MYHCLPLSRARAFVHVGSVGEVSAGDIIGQGLFICPGRGTETYTTKQMFLKVELDILTTLLDNLENLAM